MKKISILIITIFTCFSLVAGCTNANKIANFEIVFGTYDLPIEVTDKQMNKIVKVLNSYSFEGKEKTNEEHLEEDCFEISYTKDGLRYKWDIRKTTTSVLVFKDKDLEYNHLTTDTQLLNEICEIVFDISFEEKEKVDLLFTGYAKLLDSQSVDIAEEFVNENKERYENYDLLGIHQDMNEYSMLIAYSDDHQPIKVNDDIGAEEEYESFEAMIKSKLEDFYFKGKQMDFFDENNNVVTKEISEMKDEYLKDKNAVIKKVAGMVSVFME